jgi:hypothetical protein
MDPGTVGGQGVNKKEREEERERESTSANHGLVIGSKDHEIGA